MTANHLYRLSQFRKPDFRIERKDQQSGDLFARPVFVGPDAAIEVEGNVVRGFVNGEPSHPLGQLAKFIRRYKDRIRTAASAHQLENVRKVIFSGTWHHIDFNVAPRFEPCLTHLVEADGSTVTALYDQEIFEWDGARFRAGYGFGFGKDMHGPIDRMADTLKVMADYEVCKGRGKYKGASGLGAVGGMLWLSRTSPQIPVLFSPATCTSEIEFELDEEEEVYRTGQPIVGDGTILAAYTSKLRDIKSELGWFRGKDVDRSVHRPRKVKLFEAPDAIDAIGYWEQVRSDSEIAAPQFRFFGGASEWDQEVLELMSDANADGLFGNLYASDWIYDPSFDDAHREVRLLALGPVPTLSLEPL